MLSFQEQGQGPALVLIHAFPLDRRMWQNQVEVFSKTHRVVTLDVFGFGGSQPPRSFTMTDMGNALLELLDHLKIEKCTLAGLSMGGYIVLPFALAHPERVERLVLAHTRARGDRDAEKTARNAMIEGIKKDGVASLPDKMIPRLLAANAKDEVKKAVADFILQSSADACVHAVTAMRDRADQMANLRKLTCPTLVVAGDADAIISVEDCANAADEIKHGVLRVLAGSGHLSNLEDPAAFNEALDEFLRLSGSR